MAFEAGICLVTAEHCVKSGTRLSKTDFRCVGFIIKLSRLHPKEELN